MESNPGRVLKAPALTGLEISLELMFSNVMSLYIAGNRRPGRVLKIESKKITAMIDAGLRSPETWMNAVLKIDQTDFFDSRKRVDKLDEEAKTFVDFLRKRPQLEADFGDCLARDLLDLKDGSEPYWKRESAISPPVGYPRPYLEFDRTPTYRVVSDIENSLAAGTPPQHGITKLPAIGSRWNRGIAASLFLADRARLGRHLIPAIGTEVDGLDAKSTPFGTLAAIELQLQQIHSVLSLYLVQGSLLYAHAVKRSVLKAYDLAYAVEPTMRSQLETWRKAYDAALTVPLHPLLSVIANGLQTGTLFTFWGEHECMYFPENVKLPMIDPDDVCALASTSALQKLVLDAASFDSLLNPTRVAKDGIVTGSCHLYDWNFEGDTKVANPDGLTYGDFARVVGGAATLTSHWPKIAGHLGWSSISADVGRINAYGSDFMLCDGIGYSKPPAAGLLGLTPVLSAGNQKLFGIARRHDERFNVKNVAVTDGINDPTNPTVITHSVMVVEGHQGSMSGKYSLERLYLPRGMWMGESDIVRVNSETLTAQDDYIAKEIIDYWTKQQSGYVRMDYGPASKTPPPEFARQTDWDPWAVAVAPTDARSAFLELMGTEVDPVKDIVFITRKTEGAVFYHRFLVKMARPNHFLLFNQLGSLIKKVVFDGHVIYNNAVDTSIDTGVLEAVVNSAPALTSSGSKSVDDALKAEVEVVKPEGTAG